MNNQRPPPYWKRLCITVVTLVLCLLTSTAAFAGRVPADAPHLPEQAVTLAPLPHNFDTFESDWLHLAYPPSQAHRLERLISEANEFRAEVSQRLGQKVLDDVHVRLAEDPSQMATLAPVGAPYPKYAVGVAYSRLGLILLTVEPVHAGSDHDLYETFRHELAHVALHQAVERQRVPLWFNEGLAIHLSKEKAFGRMQTLWTATVSGNLLPLSEIERRFPDDVVGVPLAYAQSADVVRYLLRQEDQERFQLLIKRVRRGQAFDSAMYDAYGIDTQGLEYNWREDVQGRYSIWPMLFSGTAIWVFAIALATVAWRRKRKRQTQTLARWAKEEATQDAREAAVAAKASVAPWMVVRPEDGVVDKAPGAQRDSVVPKVEHEGDWHTLH